MTAICYEFEHPAIAFVDGADALRYLNARLSQRIEAGASGTLQDAAALNSKGRCDAFFQVISLEEKWLLYQSNDPDRTALPALKQFLVADRVTVTDSHEQYSLYHLVDITSEELPLPDKAYGIVQHHNSFIIKYPRVGNAGYDLLLHHSDQDTLSVLLQQATSLSHQEFELRRMKSGQVSYPQEINDKHFFLESGHTHSYSTEKGCYVGQEAVEMSLARGKLPAGMMRFRLPEASAAPGDTITNEEDKTIGSVLSSAIEDATGNSYGFARIRKAQEYTDSLPMYVDGKEGILYPITKELL